MKKFTSWAIILCLLTTVSMSVRAQADGDYRTLVAGVFGTWSTVGIWQVYDSEAGDWVAATNYPTAATAGTITIRNSDSVQLTGINISIDQVHIEAGGSLLIFNSTTTLQNNPSGSAINVDGGLYIASGGTLTGPGSIRINAGGFMQVRNSGILAVNSVINGALEFNNTATIGNVQSATVTNNGTTNWVSGDINIQNSSSFINNGTFNISTPATAQILGASPSSLTNSASGVIEKTTSALTNVSIPFTNAGTLQGAGTYRFNNTIANSGSIAPAGNSSGILTLVPTVIGNPLGASSNLRVNILTSTTPGAGHDQIVIDNAGTTTTTALNGTLTIVDNPGVAPLGVYTILTSTGDITGTFANVVKPSNFADPVYDYVNGVVTIEKLALVPVTWGNFTAAAKNGTVYLNWNTLSESNTSHFDIEFSIDDRNYTSIATVAAKGNSATESFYSYAHHSSSHNGNMYFRLKQVDIDGRFTYSDTRIVRHGENVSAVMSLAPNPVGNNGTLVTILANQLTLRLSDLNGRVIQTWKLGQGNHRIYLNEVPSGNYILTGLENNRVVHTQKLIKR